MKTSKSILIILVALGTLALAAALFSTPAPAVALSATETAFIDHAGELLAYNGAETCLACHAEQVATFGDSNHYKWAGKLNKTNDFCTYPNINLGLGKLTTTFGTIVDGGCLACHAGLGFKPTGADPTKADCLTCHADDYKRTVALVDGLYRYIPNLAAMPAAISIDATPQRGACLSCHASSGGGHNNKRGDITLTLVNPSYNDDVHMSSGLVCVDCHQTVEHKMAGQGVDMRIDEGTPMRPCKDCHNIMKDMSYNVKRHFDAVSCQACHIPEYARTVSTDMLRDYQHAEVNARGLNEPVITRASDVVPEYAFWNGEAEFYEFGEPAQEGEVLVSLQGDINDGKLFPFRVHQAVMMQDPVSGVILPVKSSILFQTGDMNQAILVGAQQAGFTLTEGYTFINTTRWMGIYHEMPDADYALGCEDCHADGGRVDFSALGYDPKLTRNNKPLCVSCHQKRTGLDFYQLHDQHARGRRITCDVCHSFKR